MAAEQLVDGMDLTHEWCRLHLSTYQAAELKFAVTLVEGKGSRVADFNMDLDRLLKSEDDARSRFSSVPGLT